MKFDMKKIIVVVIGLLIIGIGLFFGSKINTNNPELTQDKADIDDVNNTENKPQESDLDTPKDWVKYKIPETQMSFEHPFEWKCETRKRVLGESWQQTTCLNDKINPLVVINTPHADSSESGIPAEVSSRESLAINNLQLTKEVLTWGHNSVIEYVSGATEEEGSFMASFLFRRDEGTTLEETETLANKILNSIIVKD